MTDYDYVDFRYRDTVPFADVVRSLVDDGWQARRRFGGVAYHKSTDDGDQNPTFESLDDVLEFISPDDEGGSIKLEHQISLSTGTASVDMDIRLNPWWADPPTLELEFDHLNLEKRYVADEVVTKHLQHYLDAVRLVLRQHPPMFGYGDMEHSIHKYDPPSRAEILVGEPYVWWMLLLPLGEAGHEWDRLKDAPCWDIERVSHDFAMLRLWGNPAEPPNAHYREPKQRRLKKYLQEL